MLGSMAISVLLCCCSLMSFCPSGFAVCLSDSLESMEKQQHFTNLCRRNPSSSFEVHEWNLLSSLFFCLTPTLVRVVLGLFCISGLWSHPDSWKTLLSGFAFLLKSDTSEVWKEKCKFWLSSSLSYGKAAVQSIFSTELRGASPPFEAGEHWRRVVLGWKAAWNTCAARSIYTVWLLCNPLALLFISVQCKHLYSVVRSSCCRRHDHQKLDLLWSKDPRNTVTPRSSRIKVMKTEGYLPRVAVVYAVLVWTCEVEGSQENREEPGGEVSDSSRKLVLSHSHPFHLTCRRDSKVVLQWKYFSLGHHAAAARDNKHKLYALLETSWKPLQTTGRRNNPVLTSGNAALPKVAFVEFHAEMWNWENLNPPLHSVCCIALAHFLACILKCLQFRVI